MPRDRRKVERRIIEPDSRYNSILISQFVNKILSNGKKSVATKIVYDSLDIVSEKMKQDGLAVFDKALRNVTPSLEVKARRIGGATYQVPIEVKGRRKNHLSMSWLRDAAKARKGKAFAERLADEILDAYHETGAAFKKKEDTHKMAEANRAFAHFARY